jgi:uncharacterized protein YifN (PemK superfamily)
MIVVTYEEEVVDATSGSTTRSPLGVESHDGIDEVVLPSRPAANAPIFLTKKFAGNDEYRWQVLDVCQNAAALPRIEYLVTLGRRNQLPKEAYLKNILVARNQRAKKVILQWAFVEVEFGHPLTVGKANGHVRSNKRYADTIQLYSMPKRRLAIVTQVIERTPEDLVQVVPITSKQPHSSDRSSMEVTAGLTDLVHYQKQSWAVCKMIQTVTASRIIAPMTKVSATKTIRDTGFRSMIRGEMREQLKDTLMHGVSLGYRIGADTHTLVTEQRRNADLTTQVGDLNARIAELETRLRMCERFVEDSDMSMEDLETMYPQNPS